MQLEHIPYNSRVGSPPLSWWTTYLVRGIANANIKIGQFGLHHIAQDNLEALLGRGSLKTLGDFSRHTRIQFHGHNLLRLLQDLCRQVSSSGTDFEDDLL